MFILIDPKVRAALFVTIISVLTPCFSEQPPVRVICILMYSVLSLAHKHVCEVP